jgi:hypothetical protein
MGRFPKVQTTTPTTLSHQGRSFQFRQDGWFNMTQAALHFDKRLDNYCVNAATKAYVEALRQIPGIPGNLTQATRGVYSITWAHPKQAAFFARWLDGRLAVWCCIQPAP